MAVTATALASNAHALDQRHLPYFTISGTANLGTLYQTGGMNLSAAILRAAVNTAFGASIPAFTSLLFVQCGISANGLAAFDFVPATGLILARTRGTTATAVAGTASTLPVITRVTAEALVVVANTANLAHTPLAVEAVQATVGGVVGACNLRNNAAANSRDCYYNPAGPSVNFLAADAVTAATASYIWLSTAGAANTLTVVTPGLDPAEVALNFDLSNAGYNFEFTAVVAQ